MAVFETDDISFCTECGTLLPTVTSSTVQCPRCKATRSATDFLGVMTYTHSREFAFQKPKFNTQEATATQEKATVCSHTKIGGRV
eukprot:m.71635 g.71635  ORF g.71635 m.71635 type:complete len:85 (+) comp16913_c0_seq1:53-307(+)